MRRSLSSVLVLPLLLAGCAMTFDATRVGVPVTMASSAATPAQGEEFKVRSSALFGLWGAVPLHTPSLDRALATQLVGAEEIRDVRISVRSSFPQVLLTVLTLGLLVPRTVEYRGVIPGKASPAAGR